VLLSITSQAFSQTIANHFTPSGVSGGGRLLSAALNPQNPSHMFIGCDMGGLYRTENEGLTWSLVPSSNASDSNTSDKFGAALRTEMQDKGSTVIPPGQGWFVTTRYSSNNVFHSSAGLVRSHAFRHPLALGITHASLGFPVAMSLTTNRCLQADGFVATTSPPLSDRVQFWLGDTSVTQGWQTYWYYNGAPMEHLCAGLDSRMAHWRIKTTFCCLLPNGLLSTTSKQRGRFGK
jgi:hypothetical protein